MQYTITINQLAVINAGLNLDVVDMAIFDQGQGVKRPEYPGIVRWRPDDARDGNANRVRFVGTVCQKQQTRRVVPLSCCFVGRQRQPGKRYSGDVGPGTVNEKFVIVRINRIFASNNVARDQRTRKISGLTPQQSRYLVRRGPNAGILF